MPQNDEETKMHMTTLVRILAFLERLDRPGENKKAPPEECTILDQWAENASDRARNFLVTLDGDDGPELADILGWPSAVALRAFVHNGRLPHEKTH